MNELGRQTSVIDNDEDDDELYDNRMKRRMNEIEGNWELKRVIRVEIDEQEDQNQTQQVWMMMV